MLTRLRGDLAERTFRFAKSVLDITDALPNNQKGWVVGRQLMRSGTAVGANVREADNAFSDSDFAYKCSIARKEASETLYWLELCGSTGLLDGEQLRRLMSETEEIVRVLSSIVQKTQRHLRKQ
ncbi:MAG: four helix bundle protein [Phycisphaerae bacterium]